MKTAMIILRNTSLLLFISYTVLFKGFLFPASCKVNRHSGLTATIRYKKNNGSFYIEISLGQGQSGILQLWHGWLSLVGGQKGCDWWKYHKGGKKDDKGNNRIKLILRKTFLFRVVFPFIFPFVFLYFRLFLLFSCRINFFSLYSVLNGRVKLILPFHLDVTLKLLNSNVNLSSTEMLLMLPFNIAPFLFPTKRDNNIINWFWSTLLSTIYYLIGLPLLKGHTEDISRVFCILDKQIKE